MDSIKIRPGYACINLSNKERYRKFRLSSLENQDMQKIKEVIYHNIEAFNQIIKWNIEHNIYVYRVTSDIIPFYSHPDMIRLLGEHPILEKNWVIKDLLEIKENQKRYNLRLSMHPSQFTLLTSPKKDVTERSILDINRQTEFIKKVGGKNVIIHIGGAYGNKKEALKRFKEHVKYVDKDLLTIENDDKTYCSYEVVSLCDEVGLKWVYDYHHERCNKSIEEDIVKILKYKEPDKYHLSTGTPNIDSLSHADYILKENYVDFKRQLIDAGIMQADVVFEAKAKNLAIPAILKPLKDGIWQLK